MTMMHAVIASDDFAHFSRGKSTALKTHQSSIRDLSLKNIRAERGVGFCIVHCMIMRRHR